MREVLRDIVDGDYPRGCPRGQRFVELRRRAKHGINWTDSDDDAALRAEFRRIAVLEHRDFTGTRQAAVVLVVLALLIVSAGESTGPTTTTETHHGPPPDPIVSERVTAILTAAPPAPALIGAGCSPRCLMAA